MDFSGNQTRDLSDVIKMEGEAAIICKSRSSAAAVAAAASIFTSLNKSIFTFHNRLLRCLSRFLCLATTAIAANQKLGYKKLKKHEQWPHLRRRNDKKRTIFLDLDETLVHSTMEPPIKINSDFMVTIKIEGVVIRMFVVKRPGVTEFLERLSKNYRVEVFTAGVPEYASQVLDKLDKDHVISQRLYRDSCTEMNGRYAKDLSLPENGVPIKPFIDDMEDKELMKLAEFFDGCYQYEDLRDATTDFMYNNLI